MAYLLLAIVLAIFWLNVGFLAVASAVRILSSGLKLPIETRLTCYVLLLVGVPADVVYNAFVGSVRFREWPQWNHGELMYSGRVGRLAREDKGWRGEKALTWARVLNAAWPGHESVPA
jgi:hypothetical protein